MNELSMTGQVGLAALLASVVASLVIVGTQRWHGVMSMDNVLTGAQKFHSTPVPRVGGLALAFGLIAATLLTWGRSDAFRLLSLGLLASLPVFLAGLSEDLTKRGSILLRLLASFASPLIAASLIGAILPRVDVIGLDQLMQWLPFALLVTAFAVGGITHAMNIIDGFNGLAGITGLLILAALGFLAWRQGDELLMQFTAAGFAGTLGFLLLNFPTGRLFMGDGGAYLLGFWIAVCAVLLVARHAEVNAWQVLAITAYPVIETLYSVYRKKLVRKTSPGVPDRLHFHMLVNRRLASRFFSGRSAPAWQRNAFTAVLVVAFTAPFTVAAAWLGDTIAGAVLVMLVQILAYLATYARLVRGHWCLNPAVGFGFRSEHWRRGVS